MLAGYLLMVEIKGEFPFFLLTYIYHILYNEYITFMIRIK